MTNSLERTDTSEAMKRQWADQEKVHRRQVERMYHLKKRNDTYIALEDTDFTWDLMQVTEFEYLWREGYSLQGIAEYFDRDIDEVALLLMDRIKKDKIKPRKRGIFAEFREVM